jgi:hypothetical protein
MEDFEKTALRDVQKQVDNGIGFVVGDHNYGRVDRLSDEELDTVAGSAGKTIEQASRLLDAIAVVSQERQES